MCVFIIIKCMAYTHTHEYKSCNCSTYGLSFFGFGSLPLSLCKCLLLNNDWSRVHAASYNNWQRGWLKSDTSSNSIEIQMTGPCTLNEYSSTLMRIVFQMPRRKQLFSVLWGQTLSKYLAVYWCPRGPQTSHMRSSRRF